MFLCPENSELPCLILLRLEFYQRKTNLSYSHMRGDKYKSPNYVVSRAHISYLHHCAPHKSGISSCCTQPYYRKIDCQKVSSSFPECAQTSWPVDYYIPVWCDEGVFVRKKTAIWSVIQTVSQPPSHLVSQSQSTNQSYRQSV